MYDHMIKLVFINTLRGSCYSQIQLAEVNKHTSRADSCLHNWFIVLLLDFPLPVNDSLACCLDAPKTM